jgi:hypothetical protein
MGDLRPDERIGVLFTGIRRDLAPAIDPSAPTRRE